MAAGPYITIDPVVLRDCGLGEGIILRPPTYCYPIVEIQVLRLVELQDRLCLLAWLGLFVFAACSQLLIL